MNLIKVTNITISELKNITLFGFENGEMFMVKMLKSYSENIPCDEVIAENSIVEFKKKYKISPDCSVNLTFDEYAELPL